MIFPNLPRPPLTAGAAPPLAPLPGGAPGATPLPRPRFRPLSILINPVTESQIVFNTNLIPLNRILGFLRNANPNSNPPKPIKNCPNPCNRSQKLLSLSSILAKPSRVFAILPLRNSHKTLKKLTKPFQITANFSMLAGFAIHRNSAWPNMTRMTVPNRPKRPSKKSPTMARVGVRTLDANFVSPPPFLLCLSLSSCFFSSSADLTFIFNDSSKASLFFLVTTSIEFNVAPSLFTPLVNALYDVTVAEFCAVTFTLGAVTIL